MNGAVLRLVSKETMEQYEKLRRSGLCNMFDLGCVHSASGCLGFTELEDISESFEDYAVLLGNFGGLIKHYGITQEGK